MVIRELKPKKPKLRRKGYHPEKIGNFIQIDAILKFIWGIKRYIITAFNQKLVDWLLWYNTKKNSFFPE